MSQKPSSPHALLVRPVQPLLFWQVLACAWVSGAAAFWSVQALLVPVLMLWVDSRARHPARGVVLLLCVAAGFGWAQWRAPQIPAGNYEQVLTLRAGTLMGRVAQVRGQYDRRLSVILQQATLNGIALPGDVVWTREGSVTGSEGSATGGEGPVTGGEGTARRPIAGEVVRFEARVRALTGAEESQRAGGGIARYWQSRGVFWQVWTPANVPVEIRPFASLPAEMGGGFWRNALGGGLPGAIWGGSSAALEHWREAFVARLHALYPDNPPPLRYGRPAPSAPHGWGLLPALIFGDRHYLGAEDTQRLQRAGLAHSIALSGQHLAVAGLFAAAMLWAIGRFRPEVFLRRPRFVLLLWFALPLAALYLWMGNAPPSLQRAFIMLCCWALFCTLHRPAAFVDGLVAALVCMVIMNPAGLADVGLQLSFGAVGGLALASPLLWRWYTFSAEQPLLSGMGATFLSSMAIQVTLLPLVLTVFGWITPWAWLNVLWLPVLGLWVLPLGFLAALTLGLPSFMSGLTDALLLAASEPCFWLLEGLAWLDTHTGLTPAWCLRPHWLAFAGFVCVLGALSLSLGRRQVPRAGVRLCVVGLLLLSCGPFLRVLDGFSGEIRLRLLDVGQGQAALLEFPGEQRVLVDGGGFSSPRFDSGRDLIAPVLTANRPPRLTAIALSHADLDHLRGLLFLARHFDIGSAMLPVETPSSGHATAVPLLEKLLSIMHERGIAVRRLSGGDQIVIPGVPNVWLDVLAPIPGRVTADNDGLVLRLVSCESARESSRELSRESRQQPHQPGLEVARLQNAHTDTDGNGNRGLAILPGDATKSLLADMLRGSSRETAFESPVRTKNSSASTHIQAEVLVAPHHGSKQNVQELFMRAVNPAVVLASCAKNNRYGFPSDELRELCAMLNIPLRSTSEEGEITWRWRLPATRFDKSSGYTDS